LAEIKDTHYIKEDTSRLKDTTINIKEDIPSMKIQEDRIDYI
jgi:hypothetical protein